MATAFGTAAAAYDPTLVSVGALDAELAETVNGSARSTSFFQVMGTAPDTGASIVSGDFPAPTVEQISAGAVTELVNLSTSSSSGSLANQYPGCDTPDIVLANGQRWAACNVGSTTAYAGQAYPTDAAPTDAQKAYLGALFQWGRNEDVTSLGTGSTLASSGSTSSTALGIFVTNGTGSYDWISTRNDNLW